MTLNLTQTWRPGNLLGWSGMECEPKKDLDDLRRKGVQQGISSRTLLLLEHPGGQCWAGELLLGHRE